MGKQYKKEKSGGNSLRDNNPKPSESIYGEQIEDPVYGEQIEDPVYGEQIEDPVYGEDSIIENIPTGFEQEYLESRNRHIENIPTGFEQEYLESRNRHAVKQSLTGWETYNDDFVNLPIQNELPEQNGKYSKVKSMIPGMEIFDKELKQTHIAGSRLPSTTFYANTPEKKKPFEREFKDGKLDGLDTVGSRKAGAIGAKGDRHIFTMDNQGKFTTGDAVGENTKNFNKSVLLGKNTQERLHHSSFSAGKAVAGAGELQVRDGQVEIFSDTSGHYRPGSEQMHNVAKELEDQNAGVEKITAEFIGKVGGEKQISASALEILGWGSGKDNPEQSKIEENIRGSHAKKDKVMEELLAKRKTIG